MPSASLRAGDAVRIRGERWHVAAESSFDGLSIVDVDGCDATNQGTHARFILPFERVDRVASRGIAPRVVPLERWRRAVRAILAAATPRWSSLRAAARARLAVLPFQLEPALAVTRGDACRVLIADEVGLGKTIQAGLIVAETVARTPDARVLVVAPAGLRDQWRSELDARFGLTAEVLDAEGIARTAAHLVPDVNPWSIHPVAITSIDYVKRPEVMRSLEALTWDVLVFDEAHTLAGRSDRAAAASALSRRARCVVTLTATPHSGEDEAFARLTSLGDLDGNFPLMTFRRQRADVGLPHGRRTVSLNVRLSNGERRVHEALQAYVARLEEDANPGSLLVASILLRRACSSAWSLARSLERRLELLTNTAREPDDQLTLPFGDADGDEEPGRELAARGLRDSGEELRCLTQLAALAQNAATDERKMHALRRLVRRAGEPVLVFTEYRDTLQHLATQLADCAPLQLHGALSPRERLDVLRRFTHGEARVLVATDAASEGLNLHYRCRLVVNLELPWTPLRLEQRIGRVDRLGQARRVHAVQLIARNSHEEAIATRLDVRSGRVNAAFEAVGAADPALRRAAVEEAARLLVARGLARDIGPRSHDRRPLLTIVQRERIAPAAVWAFTMPCIDSGGHLVYEAMAAVLDARRLAVAADDDVHGVIGEHHRHVVSMTAGAMAAPLALARRREEAVVKALRESHARLSAALLQPGLFDRRAERAAAAQTARVDEAIEKSRQRLASLARCEQLRPDDPLLLFGIVYR